MDNSSIFISKAVKENIESTHHTTNTLCLPNSLPIKKIDGSQATELLKKYSIDQEFKILIPGRFHFKKGHLQFLDEFAEFLNALKLQPYEVALIFAGDGPERTAIEEKIHKLNINPYVYLLGEIPHDTLLSLHKNCNLVVIPSLREGFGNVAIEGLMQRSVMLTSGVDGLGEIIEDGRNGFTYDVHVKGAASKKLIYLYQNRKIDLIDKESLYTDFLSKYTLGSQMEQILTHLKKFEDKE
ncbi:glycosyltransferase family 4 protein [Fulvivirga sedimenti]|uniref:Glycosyltransferase family 4 protein n=1 Tax=Fulvivirga sedimenti TaxID=2879465 RepID=A0A9X1L2M7_9BACT|nr:glycosyltransferase family 4 protein [Fulvivirga sedimenti]MCA6078361.1 glycosyltransferase family 4 protein [Fulvivirga sedimenti]